MRKKKKNKKRKLKVFRVFQVLLILLIFVGACYLLTLIPVRGYYVYDNKYFSDEEILNMLNLNNKTSYLLTNSILLNQRIKDNKVIKKVEVNKTLYFEFKIKVTENRMVFYDLSKNKMILENGEEIDFENNDIPILTNTINNKKIYKSLYKKITKIDEDVLEIVSEIRYDPNEVDEERFLFSMNDGNYVYVTLSKISKINDYEKIVESIKDQKGILYLDYGNYFVPKDIN